MNDDAQWETHEFDPGAPEEGTFHQLALGPFDIYAYERDGRKIEIMFNHTETVSDPLIYHTLADDEDYITAIRRLLGEKLSDWSASLVTYIPPIPTRNPQEVTDAN